MRIDNITPEAIASEILVDVARCESRNEIDKVLSKMKDSYFDVGKDLLASFIEILRRDKEMQDACLDYVADPAKAAMVRNRVVQLAEAMFRSLMSPRSDTIGPEFVRALIIAISNAERRISEGKVLEGHGILKDAIVYIDQTL